MEGVIEVSGTEFWDLTQKAAKLDAAKKRLGPAVAEYREAHGAWEASLGKRLLLEETKAVGARLRDAEAHVLAAALIWLGGET